MYNLIYILCRIISNVIMNYWNDHNEHYNTAHNEKSSLKVLYTSIISHVTWLNKLFFSHKHLILFSVKLHLHELQNKGTLQNEAYFIIIKCLYLLNNTRNPFLIEVKEKYMHHSFSVLASQIMTKCQHEPGA